jgi:hypothetical protein
MSYYGTSDDVLPTPTPEPTPSPDVRKPSLAAVALLVAIAGLFLPMGSGSFVLPIPPIIETVVDPDTTVGSYVVVVEQTEDRSLEDAKIMRDVPYQQDLVKRGLKWRPYDYELDAAAPYRALADEVGMPAVIILAGEKYPDGAGKILDKFKMTSKEELDARVVKATGR